MQCTEKQYNFICHLLTQKGYNADYYDRVRDALRSLGLVRPPQSGITKSSASMYIDQLQKL